VARAGGAAWRTRNGTTMAARCARAGSGLVGSTRAFTVLASEATKGEVDLPLRPRTKGLADVGRPDRSKGIGLLLGEDHGVGVDPLDDGVL
jgi:hypothetical protein